MRTRPATPRLRAPTRLPPRHALYQGVSSLAPNRTAFPKKQRTRRSRDQTQSMRTRPQLRAFAHHREPSAPCPVSGREFTRAEPNRSFPRTKNAAQPRSNPINAAPPATPNLRAPPRTTRAGLVSGREFTHAETGPFFLEKQRTRRSRDEILPMRSSAPSRTPTACHPEQRSPQRPQSNPKGRRRRGSAVALRPSRKAHRPPPVILSAGRRSDRSRTRRAAAGGDLQLPFAQLTQDIPRATFRQAL